MKAFASCRCVFTILLTALIGLCTSQSLLAQCSSGFPSTTADADCAGGTTLTNNANINSGQSYGFCGPNTTTYNFSGVNLAGGTLRICGNANISGNWNSGTIVVSCGATANFTSGLTLNSNVGVINYGTINITGDLVFQNGGNYVYNESSTSVIKISGNLTYPQNNGTNAYLKNAGYIKVSGTFNAYEGGYTCFSNGGQMEVNNFNYYNNCANNTNRFTFSSPAGTAILRISGGGTVKSTFTASANWQVYKASTSTVGLQCNGSWGSATVVNNTAALTAPGAQTCSSVSTCWNVLASGVLGAFSARSDGTRVELTWATKMESGSKDFEVQRSADGVNWEKIETIRAMGNSLIPAYYRTYDNEPGNGVRYYRIVLVSLDGLNTYSQIVAVNGETGSNMLSVYPNPGTSGNQITLTGWNDAKTHVFVVYNSVGQRVFAGNAQNAVAISIPRLNAGVYFILTDAGSAQRRVTYVQR